MRPDIAPGGTFPDYRLPDHTSTPRTLSELQGDDPLILTLARGHYCPKEHQQHLELALWHDLRAVTSEIRPDWDLSTPGSARLGTRATFRPSTDGTSGHAGNGQRRDAATSARHHGLTASTSSSRSSKTSALDR